MARWFHPPGLLGERRCSHRRKPGSPQLGTAAHQGKALGVEVPAAREAGTTPRSLHHPCDPTGPRADRRGTQAHPVPAGWIPQGGGRPRLWRFFPRFLIAEKSGPAERPPPSRRAGTEKLEKNDLPPTGIDIKNRLGRSPLGTPLGYGAGHVSSLWSALVWCQFRKAAAPGIVHS